MWGITTGAAVGRCSSLIFCCFAALAYLAVASQPVHAKTRTSAIPQGDSLASIAKLPDWSGAWRNVSSMKHFIRHGTAPYKDLVLPFNERGAKKFAELKAINDANGYFPSRMERCVPIGIPGDIDNITSIFQALFTPGQVTFVGVQTTRRIYTDGRKHNEEVSTYNGDSIGHWEQGGVLVVDTVGLDPNNEIIIGLKQGENVHVVERIHRQGTQLIDDVTVTAPDVLAAPWRYQAVFEHDDHPLIDYTCSDNRITIDPKTGQPVFDVNLPAQD